MKKRRSLPLENQLFDQKLWNTVLIEFPSPKPNFSKIALVSGMIDKIRTVEFNFSSNRWVGQLMTHGRTETFVIQDSELQISNFKFYKSKAEKMGLGIYKFACWTTEIHQWPIHSLCTHVEGV